MQLSKNERKAIGISKVVGRTFTGAVSAPIKLLTLLGTLILVITILVGCTFLFKYINQNYTTFQERLKSDPEFESNIVNAVNSLIGLWNIGYRVTQVAIEIWNYIVPSLNFTMYIFYDVFVSILLTIFGGGINTNTSGYNGKDSGPDPTSTLSGDTDTYLNMIECILMDLLSIFAGVFKSFARAWGACLMVIFDWLEENLQQQMYRQQYCNRGGNGKMGTSADWGNTSTDPESGRDIYDDGTGPGNTCPDNTPIIQSLIKFFTMVINFLRDVFILIFPIIADILKMVFDSLLKILPQIMEAIIAIIEIFGPEAPLGKMLMLLLNFMIQALGYYLKSCVLQLMMAIVMCLFNVVVAVVFNAIRGIIETLVDIVCLDGIACDPDIPGDYLAFPSCDWSSFTDCVEQNYDDQQRDVSTVCQISTCSYSLKNVYQEFHQKMLSVSSNFEEYDDYKVEYHKQCIETHSNNITSKEETVQGHLFCRYLTEEVHKPTPLGLDPSNQKDVYEEGDDFCQDVRESCICKYNSPICESQTCCLTYYTVIVHQIISDMEMGDTCDLWEKKKDFAQIYCVSRTQRSLEASHEDLLGTATHCDGFVSLMNSACGNKTNGTLINVKGVIGGMCDWVDKAGFCDSFRRPKSDLKIIKNIAEVYNTFLISKNMKKQQRRMKTEESTSYKKKKYFSQSEIHTDRYTTRWADSTAEFHDHYQVALHVLSEVAPLVTSMILKPSLTYGLGSGQSPSILNDDYSTPDGRLRHIRLENNYKWMDTDENTEIRSVQSDGKHYDWEIVSSVEPSPYSDPGCTSQSTSGYPDATTFNCQKHRITSSSQGTGKTVTVLTGPDQAQDRIEVMISNSTVPITEKTVNRTTFQEPTKTYNDLVFDYDINGETKWNNSFANLNNKNPNTRVPLTRKNSTNTGPGGTTLYGNSAPTLEECPIPKDFPWKKVTGVRDSFLVPFREFAKKIPQWTEENIPEKHQFDIPNHVRESFKKTAKERTNRIPKDVNVILSSYTEAIKHASDLSSAFSIIRGRPSLEMKTAAQKEHWLSMNLQGFPTTKSPSFLHSLLLGDPQTTTDLCINRLLNPYECCTDTSTAYECCYGLYFCIPPLPALNLTRINNLDSITNAQCDGASNIVNSILFLPRVLFGAWLWTLIFMSPTWLRQIEFDILYPLIYDYGGLGLTENFVGDFFCFIVNLYYPLLFILGFIALYLIDSVFLQTFREIIIKVDIAEATINTENVKEYTEIQIENLNEQIETLSDRLKELENK